MSERVLITDTAIVGGGATGLYACLKLNQRRPEETIALFESSDRLGGRIETVEMDGFLAEYGPMRFERAAQPLLMGLIDDLGLETSHFPPYMADTVPESLFDLEADRPGPSPGKDPAGLYNALELLSLGIVRIFGASGGDMNDPRDPLHRQWWSGLDEDFYRHVRTEAELHGEPLYRTGFWNALAKVLSHNALQHIIRFGTFYHVVHYNPSAGEWLIFWLRGLHPSDELVGITQGTEAIITGMARELGSAAPGRVSINMGYKLTDIRQEPDGRVRLVFLTGQTGHTGHPDHPGRMVQTGDSGQTGQTGQASLSGRLDLGERVEVLARHAVLALPWSPLKYLRGRFPAPIAELADAVIPIPLVKCFFVSRTPWWDAATPPQTRSTRVPTRELHYYARENGPDGRRGMVMVYGERPSMDYWKYFAPADPHLKAVLNDDHRLLDQYLQYLGDESQPDTPEARAAQLSAVTCFGIRDWSREPFEAGCHVWKPGYRVDEAMEALMGFSLSDDPNAPKNVHICGEAYSDFQGFIEGGLRMALTVVGKIAGEK